LQWMTWEETNVYAATEPAIVEEVTKWATSTGATCSPRPESLKYQSYPAYVPSDLTQFLKSVGAPDYTIPTGQIIGPFAPDPSGLESCLDEQYIGAMGRGNTNWYWTVSAAAGMVGGTSHARPAAIAPADSRTRHCARSRSPDTRPPALADWPSLTACSPAVALAVSQAPAIARPRDSSRMCTPLRTRLAIAHSTRT
jgi:hypothetical protein